MFTPCSHVLRPIHQWKLRALEQRMLLASTHYIRTPSKTNTTALTLHLSPLLQVSNLTVRSSAMKTKLQAAGSRRCVTAVVSCLLASVLLLHLLLLTPSATTAAVSLDATASPWLWQQGRRGPAARRLLLAVQPRASTSVGGTDTNEFRVEGGLRPAGANGKPVEVGFDASMRKFPKSGSNKNHN